MRGHTFAHLGLIMLIGVRYLFFGVEVQEFIAVARVS